MNVTTPNPQQKAEGFIGAAVLSKGGRVLQG